MSVKDVLLSCYRKLKLHRWEIGLSETPLDDVINGKPLDLHWISLPFKDRWFADPFILDITDSEIIILAEEYCDQLKKGRIAKLVIDRNNFKLRSWEIILELSTHLSFPSVIRKHGKVFLCPENNESGGLNLYEIHDKTRVKHITTLCHNRLTDAIYTDKFGSRLFFATEFPNDNGKVLDIYRWNEHSNMIEIQEHIEFGENIARMAGDFFSIDNRIFRPAQESNEIYGHAVVIQEVERTKECWKLGEVRRLYSTHPVLRLGMHTFNHYKGFIVVDVKGYRHPFLGKVLVSLVNVIKRLSLESR